VIELSSSDDDSDDSTTTNTAKKSKISHDKNITSASSHDKYSFKEWNILKSDVETRDFKCKSLISSFFEFSVNSELVRFGNFGLNNCNVIFNSNKGILIQCKNVFQEGFYKLIF
jgi:hypothetical protein